MSTTDGGEIVGTDAPPAATVSVDEPSTSALLGQMLTDTGEWSPANVGDTTASLMASVGDVVDNGDGTWTWTWTPTGLEPGRRP